MPCHPHPSPRFALALLRPPNSASLSSPPSPLHLGLPSCRFVLLTPLRLPHPVLLLLDCCATKPFSLAISSLVCRAGSGTDCPRIHSGGWKCPWRALLSREGGNVGVVPGVACGGVQNRPPRTKSPSSAEKVTKIPSWFRNTLQRRLREPVAGVSSLFGGWKCRGRVELSVSCL